MATSSRLLPFATLFAAVIASAQSVELGGLAGGGALAVSSGEAAPRAHAGVEACVFCSGRFALFGEYSHWLAGNDARTGFDRVRTADLGGVGLRIQSRGRARAFFDVGLVAGRDGHTRGGGGAIGGVVVGTGVRIPWGEHWYIRPQFRAYGLSPHTLEGVDAHWAVSGAIGIGYRF